MQRYDVAFPRMADDVELAVIWVEKARRGSTRWVDRCSKAQIRAYRLRKWLKPAGTATKGMLLSIALFELPSWCIQDATPCAEELGGDWYVGGLPIVSHTVSNTFEILCLLLLLLRSGLRRVSLGDAHTFHAWHLFGALLLSCALIDCMVGAFNLVGVFPTTFRLNRLCRPLICLAYTKQLRIATSKVVRSIPKFLDVLVSLALCVGFFVWVGIVLFAHSREGDERFENWSHSFASLWILFTTANFPDVMVLSYNDHRASVIFFFVYLVISLYLLKNILMAAVYDAYKAHLKISLRSFYERRETAIDHAFALLVADSGVITMERWAAFFSAVCGHRKVGSSRSHKDESFNRWRSEFIFQALQLDCSHGISADEFRFVMEVVLDGRVYIPRGCKPEVSRRPWAKTLHALFSQGVVLFGRTISWDTFVDFMILVETMVAFGQTVVFVSPAAGGEFCDDPLEPGHFFYAISLSFTCIYVLDVSAKICVFGCERFWYHNPFRHRFDLIVVYSRFAAEVAFLVYRPSDTVIRFLVLVRIARSLRLISHVRPLQYIATLMMRLVPTYKQLGLLLLIVFYIYTTVGVQAFGGVINKNSSALDGSDFAANDYFALNFNDFLSGMVTLFVLMVVNNWYVIADGYLRATGTQWAAVFFVAFFVTTNLVILNILIALILDCSATLRDELEQQAHRVAPRGPEEEEQEQAARTQLYGRETVLRRVLLADEEEEAQLASAMSPELHVPRRPSRFSTFGFGPSSPAPATGQLSSARRAAARPVF